MLICFFFSTRRQVSHLYDALPIVPGLTLTFGVHSMCKIPLINLIVHKIENNFTRDGFRLPILIFKFAFNHLCDCSWISNNIYTGVNCIILSLCFIYCII